MRPLVKHSPARRYSLCHRSVSLVNLYDYTTVVRHISSVSNTECQGVKWEGQTIKENILCVALKSALFIKTKKMGVLVEIFPQIAEKCEKPGRTPPQSGANDRGGPLSHTADGGSPQCGTGTAAPSETARPQAWHQAPTVFPRHAEVLVEGGGKVGQWSGALVAL
jgi:hypothetical protein